MHFMLRTGVNYIGLILILVTTIAMLNWVPVTISTRVQGITIHDMVVLSDSRRSHYLLPDARLRIEIGDPALHQRDAESLQRLFPQPNEYAQVIAWGRRLVEACRGKYSAYYEYVEIEQKKGTKFLYPQADMDRGRSLVQLVITDELAAHAAWRRLVSAPGAKPEDLPFVAERVRAAIPDSSQQQALLKWTRFRREQKQTERRLPDTRYVYVSRPAAPNLPWFDWWMLYEDWCATDDMAKARQAWLVSILGGPSNLGKDRYRSLLRYGQQVLRERQRKEETALPTNDDRAAVMAAIDMLAGIDPLLSKRLDENASKHILTKQMIVVTPYGGGYLDHYHDVKRAIFPNDETYMSYMGASYGRGLAAGIAWTFEPYAVTDARSKETKELDRPFEPPSEFSIPTGPVAAVMLLFIAWLMIRGVRLASVTLPGYFLRLGGKPSFDRFRNSLAKREGHHVGVIVVGTLFAWQLYHFAPDPLTLVWTNGNLSIGTALLMAGVTGGIVWELIKNLVVIGMIRVGIDPAKTFLDDLIAFAVTAAAMLFLENSLSAILCSAIIGGLSPWTMEKLTNLRRSH